MSSDIEETEASEESEETEESTVPELADDQEDQEDNEPGEPALVTADQIAMLQPFSDLDNPQIINDALQRAHIEECPEGTILFKRDDADDQALWLISGSVDLLDENFDFGSIFAIENPSPDAIDDQSPHSITAVTTSDSIILRLKHSFLDLVLKLAESGNYIITTVAEADEDDSDWMSAMLSSPLFDFLPPSNIQALFSHFEELTLEAGERVITQGEIGDYFYVIKQGRTKVEYMTGSKSIPLAELGPGAFFGEDALISDVPRNATITMITDGSLMRLSEADFETLLQNPVMEKIRIEEVEAMMEEADPLTWILDVRTKHEYQASTLENSINVPILNLRKDLHKLDTEAVYVVRSVGDKRAELANYILLENGYNAYVLDEPRGGLET